MKRCPPQTESIFKLLDISDFPIFDVKITDYQLQEDDLIDELKAAEKVINTALKPLHKQLSNNVQREIKRCKKLNAANRKLNFKIVGVKGTYTKKNTLYSNFKSN